LKPDGGDFPVGSGGDSGLFSNEAPSSVLDRFLVQAAQIWKGSHEGGFFLMVGRKSSKDA